VSFSYDAPPPGLSKSDEDQLDLLGICYWVYGGLVALVGFLLGLGGLLPLLLVTAAGSARGLGPPPWLVGGAMAAIFALAAALILAKGVVMILVGSALRGRRSYVLCMVGAMLAVMNVPVGTALAIFTFMALNKPEAKRRFESSR
jgi:hypothetical protein